MSDVYTIAYSDLFKRLINPNPTRYGSMKYELTGLNHVHVGHFVLFFTVNKETKTVTLVDFKHHD